MHERLLLDLIVGFFLRPDGTWAACPDTPNLQPLGFGRGTRNRSTGASTILTPRLPRHDSLHVSNNCVLSRTAPDVNAGKRRDSIFLIVKDLAKNAASAPCLQPVRGQQPDSINAQMQPFSMQDHQATFPGKSLYRQVLGPNETVPNFNTRRPLSSQAQDWSQMHRLTSRRMK